MRHWQRGADVDSIERGPVWHSYNLPDVAPSYFVGNLVDWISTVDKGTASFAWFPVVGDKEANRGKEAHRQYYLPVADAEPKSFRGEIRSGSKKRKARR